MHLGEYLDHHDIPVKQFASEIGVHRTSIYRYIKGLAFPRLYVLRLIKEATDDWVTSNDMVEHYNEQRNCRDAIEEDERSV